MATKKKLDPSTKRARDVNASLHAIQGYASDTEVAHSLEDGLHVDVLRMIASGDVPAAECRKLAKLALTSLNISFCRHYT